MARQYGSSIACINPDVSLVRGLSCNSFNRFASSLDKALPKKDKASLRRMAWASKGWGSTFGITDKAEADCLAGCCPHDTTERQTANKKENEPGVFFMSRPVIFMC